MEHPSPTTLCHKEVFKSGEFWPEALHPMIQVAQSKPAKQLTSVLPDDVFKRLDMATCLALELGYIRIIKDY